MNQIINYRWTDLNSAGGWNDFSKGKPGLIVEVQLIQSWNSSLAAEGWSLTHVLAAPRLISPRAGACVDFEDKFIFLPEFLDLLVLVVFSNSPSLSFARRKTEEIKSSLTCVVFYLLQQMSRVFSKTKKKKTHQGFKSLDSVFYSKNYPRVRILKE